MLSGEYGLPYLPYGLLMLSGLYGLPAPYGLLVESGLYGLPPYCPRWLWPATTEGMSRRAARSASSLFIRASCPGRIPVSESAESVAAVGGSVKVNLPSGIEPPLLDTAKVFAIF